MCKLENGRSRIFNAYAYEWRFLSNNVVVSRNRKRRLKMLPLQLDERKSRR
uniref:hypothetical protein n=1 Tax=Dysgonomonas sp. TaxID=1891233 RepID=UPI00257B2C34|nr:hypothetical protein [Dysgonomonas sp.]